jgi:acetylornithine deacetylase/succinyl-diaminopimelate desuccinylase-like protein
VLEGIVGTLRERLQGSSVDFEVEELLLDWPLGTPPESAIVRCAQQVASKSGLEERLHGVSYGSDASKLQQLKGIPSIVFGPGSIAQAHSREECVPVEHVERAAGFYLEMARGFGRAGDGE